jgi:hypothetical protein
VILEVVAWLLNINPGSWTLERVLERMLVILGRASSLFLFFLLLTTLVALLLSDEALFNQTYYPGCAIELNKTFYMHHHKADKRNGPAQ